MYFLNDISTMTRACAITLPSRPSIDLAVSSSYVLMLAAVVYLLPTRGKIFTRTLPPVFSSISFCTAPSYAFISIFYMVKTKGGGRSLISSMNLSIHYGVPRSDFLVNKRGLNGVEGFGGGTYRRCHYEPGIDATSRLYPHMTDPFSCQSFSAIC